MKKYTLKELEARLLMFFQFLTDTAKKIGIPLQFLVNTVLVIQITAQILQIFFLYKAGKSIVGMCMLAFPTGLVALYFYYVIKNSKKRPVSLDLMRKLATLFVLIVTADFLFNCFMAWSFRPSYFTENKYVFRSEIAYTLAYTALPSFLYLLSCKQENVIIRKRKRLN